MNTTMELTSGKGAQSTEQSTAKTSNPELQQHISDFLTACRALGLSPKTTEWYAANLRLWSNWLGARDWQDVAATREFLAEQQSRSEQFFRHPKRRRIQGSLSPLTIRGYIRTIKRFFNWLVEEGRLPVNPMARIRLPKKPKRVPRALLADDFTKMLKAARLARDRALLLILRDTGCRASEICGLRIQDVDFEKRTVLVRGKGDRERFAFLSASTCRALQIWLNHRASQAPDDWLFISKKGPCTRSTIYLILRRIAKRAGILGRFNPHSFRHAFGRDWLLDGGDLSSLSDVLGHADLETTKIYSVFTAPELQALHKQHSPGAHITVRGLGTLARPAGQKFIPVKKAAKLLKRSTKLVYKLVDRHQLRAYHEPIGPYGEILMCFKEEDLKALIRKRRAKPNGRKFLTVNKTAKLLKRSNAFVRRLAAQRQLQACREPIGPYGKPVVCFRAEDVKALIQKRMVKSSSRQLLTVNKAAKLLKRPGSFVRRAAAKRELQAYREPIGPKGGLVMCFKAEDVKALMQERRKAKQPKPVAVVVAAAMHQPDGVAQPLTTSPAA